MSIARKRCSRLRSDSTDATIHVPSRRGESMSEYLETTVDKFTFRVPTDRLYCREGLWVFWLQPQGGPRVRVGLTDYLQQRSGDTTFVTIEPTGTRLQVGEDLADYETIKVSITLPSPVSGLLVTANDALELHPELVNQSPYDKGWLAEIEVADGEAGDTSLLDANAYFAVMKAQAESEATKK
jgi:glycine cleavage system H protein